MEIGKNTGLDGYGCMAGMVEQEDAFHKFIKINLVTNNGNRWITQEAFPCFPTVLAVGASLKK